MIGDSNDDTNFLYKLSLTDTQLSRLRKSFANKSSANIKFSKTQLFKILQLAGFLPSPFIFQNIYQDARTSATNAAKQFLKKEIDEIIKGFEVQK